MNGPGANILQDVQSLIQYGGVNTPAPLIGGGPTPMVAPTPPKPTIITEPRIKIGNPMERSPEARPSIRPEGMQPAGEQPVQVGGASTAPKTLKKASIRELMPAGARDYFEDFGGGLDAVPANASGISAFFRGMGGAISTDRGRGRATAKAELDAEDRTYERGYKERAEARAQRADERADESADWANKNRKSEIDARDRRTSEGRLTPDQSIKIDTIVMTEARNLRDHAVEMGIPYGTEGEKMIQQQLVRLRKDLTDRAIAGRPLELGEQGAAPTDGEPDTDTDTDDMLEEGSEAPASRAAPSTKPTAPNVTGDGSFGKPFTGFGSVKEFQDSVPIGGYYTDSKNPGQVLRRTR